MDVGLAFPLLVALVLVALAFDFLNGLHDAANSIATIVSTRVQPVEKVERQRDEDQRHQQRECEPDIHRVRGPLTYTCSMTMPCITLATSSKRSTTFSR